jgi:adenine-specific DNA-methyltransferase
LKPRTEVSADKLRGGFYTPPALVAHALQRVRSLLADRSTPVRVLEPSVGDGAFIAGLSSSGLIVSDVLGIELMPEEARKAAGRLGASPLRGEIRCGSAVAWALQPQQAFDVVVGNLPFVRFQFVAEGDRAGALRLGQWADVSVSGVANLWLPMLLAALRHLRAGGVFGLVLPAECFTGISAGSAREWLLRATSELRCDLYPSGSFPSVLQEVVVLSGRMTSVDGGSRPVVFAHHASGVGSAGFDDDVARIDVHELPIGPDSWTTLFLSSRQRDAFAEFGALPVVRRLGSVARLGVAAVTGANEFFSLSSAMVAHHDLQPWARPLLPRIRHAQGLAFTERDHADLIASNANAFLFDAGRAEIDGRPGLAAWVADGVRAGLHRRYKCRIRSPWYAVPNIKHGSLLLSKRSHRFPRLVLNRSAAVTTDTIYCGNALPGFPAEQLVAGFQNSGTLLSAELEGRAFGGGVLELVPSEVARLLIPLVPGLAEQFDRLDALARSTAGEAREPEQPRQPGQETMTLETDLLLTKAGIGVTPALMEDLAAARQVLLRRRLDRSAGHGRDVAEMLS